MPQPTWCWSTPDGRTSPTKFTTARKAQVDAEQDWQNEHGPDARALDWMPVHRSLIATTLDGCKIRYTVGLDPLPTHNIDFLHSDHGPVALLLPVSRSARSYARHALAFHQRLGKAVVLRPGSRVVELIKSMGMEVA